MLFSWYNVFIECFVPAIRTIRILPSNVLQCFCLTRNHIIEICRRTASYTHCHQVPSVFILDSVSCDSACCLDLSAFHLAISVSVGTKPCRVSSILASLRKTVSNCRRSVSWDNNALSAPITNPYIVTWRRTSQYE